MATNVARIQAELDLDSGKFHGSITSAIGQLKTFNASVNNTDRSLKNIERRVTGLGASLRDTMVVLGQFRAAMHTVWAFTGQWIASIVEANAKLERLQQLMKGLSKSSTEAGRVADSLRDMNYVLEQAKQAPFTVDAIGDAFVKLKASGIDPTAGAMQALMDGVARFGGSSEQLHRATIAIQQMAGKGVVSMEELRQQLGEAMPNAMQLMARAAGMSMAELVKTISTGRLAFDKGLQQKFFTEMEREFKGSSENMMSTWTGMTQKLKTEWLLFAQEIGKGGLFEGAKRAVQDLMNFMASPAGRQAARDLGATLGEAAKAAGNLIRWLMDNREEIVTWGKLMAMVFVASKITQFGMALVTTGAQIVNWTRTLGGLTVAVNAARAGTISWTSAIGAAAGPIGIAITAITSLIFYLNEQHQAAIRAGNAMQDYYNRTARGETVSPEEHAGMVQRLDYLKRVKKLTDEVQSYQSGSNKSFAATQALDSRMNALMAEGQKLGFVQDAENGLSRQFQTLTEKTKYMVQGYQDNISEAVKQVTVQTGRQNAAAVEKVVSEFSKSLEAATSKSAPELNSKLADLFDQMNTGKIKQPEYAAQRMALLKGALDAKVKGLEEARFTLRVQYENVMADEDKAKAVGKLIDETNRQLLAAQEERAGLSSELTILPKMGGGAEKQKVDEYLGLFQTLSGKAAELQAQLDGGTPKLEKFKELVAQGKFQGNAGLIGGIEALYKSIEALEEKVKTQKATEQLTQDLTDMEARAKADVISAEIKASGDLYSQVAAGVVGFNRQVGVMRANLGKTSMSLKDFEERVAAIRKELNKTDLTNFFDWAEDTAWENYLASLPEKEARLAAFNRRMEDLIRLREQLKKDNPERAQEIDDGTAEVMASETKRFNYENRTEWQKWIDDYKDITEEMDGIWTNAIDGMTDKMTEFVMTGKASFSDLMKDILAQIVKVLISQAVAKFIEFLGTIGPSAGYKNGGIHGPDGPVEHANGGVFGKNGTVSLRKYARGGIAKSPQLALFGEGDMNEAYVPLPDGRSIPVTMEGSSGGTMVQNSVSIQVNVSSDGNVQTTSKESTTKAGNELGQVMDAKIKQTLSEEMRPGGILWRMTHG